MCCLYRLNMMPIKCLTSSPVRSVYIDVTQYMVGIQYLALCLLDCYKDHWLILLNRFFGEPFEMQVSH